MPPIHLIKTGAPLCRFCEAQLDQVEAAPDRYNVCLWCAENYRNLCAECAQHYPRMFCWYCWKEYPGLLTKGYPPARPIPGLISKPRTCRVSTCLNAARTGVNNQESPYCSDKCRDYYYRHESPYAAGRKEQQRQRRALARGAIA